MILGTLGVNSKRKHFGRFWSIKVKKTAKSQFSLLGTVGDGVKNNILTASSLKTMTVQRVYEGVTSRASRVKCVTTKDLTASDVDQGRPRNILAAR